MSATRIAPRKVPKKDRSTKRRRRKATPTKSRGVCNTPRLGKPCSTVIRPEALLLPFPLVSGLGKSCSLITNLPHDWLTPLQPVAAFDGLISFMTHDHRSRTTNFVD